MIKLLLRLFVKNYEDVHNLNVREAYGTLAGIVGILLNLCLSAGKLITGTLSGSIAIIADGFNNLSDAGSSIVSLAGFKMAKAPAHRDHPFGHGRMEYIAGLIVAMLIILMGVELGKTSISKIFAPEDMTFSVVTLAVLAASIAVKLWMGLFNKTLGDKIDSPTLKATATDSLNDALATTIVIIAMGVQYFWAVNIDGIAGVLVAGFILWTGYNTAKDTLSPLLGQAPDPQLVEEIRQVILEYPEIIGFHDLIIHNYGPNRSMMSFHAEVPNDVDIMQLHDTIDIIEHRLKQKFHTDAVIHMDPILIDDTKTILTREKIAIIVHNIHPDCHIHDFRMTKGPKHTNLIFDLVIPYETGLDDEEVVNQVKEKINAFDDGSYYAVIEVDKNFV